MTKILVVGPSWVGDMVMAHSLFQVIKQYHPDSEIHVLAPRWSYGVLQRMPEVTSVIESPFKHGQFALWQRWRIARQQQSKQFDQAIVLPNSWKAALLPALAKIPRRRGYLGEQRYRLLNDIRPVNKARYPLQVQRFANLGVPEGEVLSQAPQPKLSVDHALRDKLLQKLQLSLQQPVLILCSGSQYGAAKRWPAKHFATVANTMLERGWQVWLLGSLGERVIADEVNRLSQGRCKNFCGDITLDEAVDMISCANAVVTNDSGLMHVAAALERKVIALFGSSSEQYTPPLSKTSEVLSLDLACRPCFKRQCPLDHLDCLNKLYPEQVTALL